MQISLNQFEEKMSTVICVLLYYHLRAKLLVYQEYEKAEGKSKEVMENTATLSSLKEALYNYRTFKE